ncbi:MAG: RsmE family RNA methyltransferase [Brevinema sp.]
MRRFFFPDIPIEPDACFSVPTDQIKHLVRVLRIKNNDLIEISNGSGRIITAQVLNADTNQVFIKIINTRIGQETPLITTAFVAELKAMDEVITILAEHGIQHIVPFFAERSIPKFDPKQAQKKQERRQKLIEETTKKVGGLYSSHIELSIPFSEIVHHLESIPQKIIFYEQETSTNLSSIDFTKPQAFFIGPEGGFTTKEIQLLKEWGGITYSLGSRILRAPQAVSAATTLIRYFTENTH